MASKNWRIILDIPDSKLTKDIVENLFYGSAISGELEQFLEYMPDRFKTDELCKLMIMVCDDADILRFIPKERFTKEICDVSLNKFYGEALKYIPEELKPKEMYMNLLELDFFKYLKYLPEKYYDDDIYAMVAVELKKIIKKKKTIDVDSLLYLKVIDLYPHLIMALNSEKRDEIITNELYSLIVNDGSINRIARKYGISVSVVQGVLEKMKEKDLNSYTKIKQILASNQRKYYFTMMEDIKRLDIIILSLGNIDGQTLNLEQKIKFAYLYYKCIHNSLEEIYSYNRKNNIFQNNGLLDKEQKGLLLAATRINAFFTKILKYNYVLGDDITIIDIPEMKTILHNNSWLKKYNRNAFFKIKNGIPTAEMRYGSDEKVLTLEIEEYVIGKLEAFDIPLNDIIVRRAFLEYFNNNLDEYLSKFYEYNELVNSMNNGKRKK